MKTIRTAGPRNVLLAAATGALLMYMLDPVQGRRRMAVGRDRALHGMRVSGHFIEVGLRDLRQRAQGLAARMRRMFDHPPVDDDTLRQRVRSALGRAVSNPHAIAVHVMSGCVYLSGIVLEEECRRLVDEVRRVPGVRQLDNRLDARRSTQGISALQGLDKSRGAARATLQHGGWAPGSRLAAVAGGIGLALYATQRRGAAGWLLGAGGVALAARALSNEPLQHTALRITRRALPMKTRAVPDSERLEQPMPGQTVSILTIDPAIVLQ